MSESTQTRSHSVATPSSSWIPFERRSGTTVYDRAGRCLGSIQNAMIDRNSGQLAYVVRVLNRGEHGIAVKSNATQANASAEDDDNLAAVVEKALEASRELRMQSDWHDVAARQIEVLTVRQREIMEMVLAGHPSKNIAADLNISRRTVENHRAAIMRRTGAKSLPELARLAVAAA